MSKMIFVSLPVTDLKASMAFYVSIGFKNNPQFTNETAACMVWSEAINFMLLLIPTAMLWEQCGWTCPRFLWATRWAERSSPDPPLKEPAARDQLLIDVRGSRRRHFPYPVAEPR
jgi:hypothetical protein